MENGIFTTLEDLKKERKRLKILNEVTKQELSNGMNSMRGEAKAMVIKNVAIPLGIAGLSVAAAKTLGDDDEDERPYVYGSDDSQSHVSSTAKGLLLSLVPIGLAILKEYLVAEKHDIENEEADEPVRYVPNEELQ